MQLLGGSGHSPTMPGWSLPEERSEKQKPPTFTMTPRPFLRQVLVASFLGSCYFPFRSRKWGSARRVRRPLPGAEQPQPLARLELMSCVHLGDSCPQTIQGGFHLEVSPAEQATPSPSAI